jgi:hypothetical protein
VFGGLTALPRRERALQVRVAFTRLFSRFNSCLSLATSFSSVFRTRVENPTYNSCEVASSNHKSNITRPCMMSCSRSSSGTFSSLNNLSASSGDATCCHRAPSHRQYQQYAYPNRTLVRIAAALL